MSELVRPPRGGFLRAFGCAEFVRGFLSGLGPHGSPKIDPSIGAPQSDICHHYKRALMRATALDRAARAEELQARREQRSIEPGNIEALAAKYLARMPYKSWGCRFHSFVVYFANLQRLGWVEPSGREEPSVFQDHHPPGPPRRYFRITEAGRAAPDSAWRNPRRALYGD